MADHEPSRPATLATGAAFAAMAALILDLVSAAPPILELTRLCAAEGFGLLMLGALFAGGAVTLLLGLGILFGRAAGGPNGTALLTALPLSAVLGVFGVQLLSGPAISEFGGVWALRFALPVGTWCVVAAVARLWVASPRTRALLMFVLAAGAVGCAVLDHVTFKNLYPAYHYGLRVSCLAAAAAVGLSVVRTDRLWRNVGRIALGAAVLVPLLAATGIIPGDDAVARRVLLVWSRTASPVLRQLVPVDQLEESDEPGVAGPVPAVPGTTLDRAFPDRRQFNVAWITVDTLRADRLSMLGYERPTSPALDALGQEAVVFERAYAQFPSSPLSFLSMLTGRYASALAVDGERPPQVAGPLLDSIRRGRHTFAATALQRSYVQRLLPYLIPGLEGLQFLGRTTVADAAQAMARADEALAGVTDQPWLAWIHLFDPHLPYRPHPATRAIPATRRQDPDWLRYDGEVAWADHHLGRFLDTLRSRPDWDRTVVVICADHGESLGEGGLRYHGNSLVEPQIHVPLIIRVPGAAARRVAEPVELVDILPTLEALLDRPADMPRHGHSLVPYFLPPSDEAPAPPGFAYSQFIHEGDPYDAIIGRRWKLVRDRGAGTVHLYDLESTEGEGRDRALDDGEVAFRMSTHAGSFSRLARSRDSAATSGGGGTGQSRLGRFVRDVEGVLAGKDEPVTGLLEIARSRMTTPTSMAALTTLALLRPEAAAATVLDAARHQSTEVRLRAARLLVFVDHPRRDPVLRDLTDDTDGDVALTARASLTLLGEGGEPAALRSAEARSFTTDLWRVAALAAADDEDALTSVGSVMAIPGVDTEVMLATWIAAGHRSESAVAADLYLRLAGERNEPLMTHSLAALLNRRPSAAAVPILRALLTDGGSEQDRALDAMVRSGLRAAGDSWPDAAAATETELRRFRTAAAAGDPELVRSTLSAARTAAATAPAADWGLWLEERIANRLMGLTLPPPDQASLPDAIKPLTQRLQGQDQALEPRPVRMDATSTGSSIVIRMSPAQEGPALPGALSRWGPSVTVELLDAAGDVVHREGRRLTARGVSGATGTGLLIRRPSNPEARSLRVRINVPGHGVVGTHTAPLR